MTRADREQELLARLRTRRKLPLPAARKQLRVDAGVSLRQLAAVIGVSHVAITRWEMGAQPADAGHAAAYGRLLGEFRQIVALAPTDAERPAATPSARRKAARPARDG
jgi:transcriptional regulator with XRE-family HTH domain